MQISAKHSGAGRHRGSSRGRSESITPAGFHSHVRLFAPGNVTLSAVAHRWFGPKLVNIADQRRERVAEATFVSQNHRIVRAGRSVWRSEPPAKAGLPGAGDTGTRPGGFECLQRGRPSLPGQPFRCSATLSVKSFFLLLRRNFLVLSYDHYSCNIWSVSPERAAAAGPRGCGAGRDHIHTYVSWNKRCLVLLFLIWRKNRT